MSFEDVLKTLPPLLVVLGWIIVNRQNDKREARKEARALVDASKKSIVELAAKAVSYHVDGKLDTAYEIKAGIEALEVECERLPAPSFAPHSPLMLCFVAFADAMTGGDFEAQSPAKKSPTSQEVATILRTRTALISELERVFRVHYLNQGGSVHQG